MNTKLGTAAVLACALVAPLTPLATTAANAAPAAAAAPVIATPVKAEPETQPVEVIKHRVVKQLVAAMADGKARRALVEALTKKEEADLTELFASKESPAADSFSKFVNIADRDVKAIKGLSKMKQSALQLRLVNPETAEKLKPGAGAAEPLFAASTSADEKDSTIVAYDVRGGKHVLDVNTRPTVPVILVELDLKKITPAAIATVSDELQAAGVGSALLSAEPFGEATSATATAARGAKASKIVTRLDSIRVSNDKEPWTSGRAEFYGMALGQGTDGKARVDLVQMPYLDYEGTTYRPNQILIDWSNYKWNAVDFMFMEHDDNSNYRDIAIAIATAIAPFTSKPEYVALATKVLSALPASWFTNDDDYADSLYFLTRNTTGSLRGAGNNAQVTLSRHVVTT